MGARTSGRLTLGVTGTNGKTSTAWMLEHVLQTGDYRTYLASTIVDRAGSEVMAPPETFQALADRIGGLARSGTTAFVLECTSHALARGFATLLSFDVAIFTNLTRDHLDQHVSFEHYLASKAQLFLNVTEGGVAVLNACDQGALLIDDVIPCGVRRLWYASPTRGAKCHDADLEAERLLVTARGTQVDLAPSAAAIALGGSLKIPLVGDCFGENALAAALALLAVGIPAHAISTGLETLPTVPGRFEIVHESPMVAIDYAHTPDALLATVRTARRLCGPLGRVFVVFGAGGGRDQGKRRSMGEAVGAADVAIVTSDNPRHEDPMAIATPIATGARSAGCPRVDVVLDRRAAIEHALHEVREADVVVICGKGHEVGQVLAHGTAAFSDADVVDAILARASCA